MEKICFVEFCEVTTVHSTKLNKTDTMQYSEVTLHSSQNNFPQSLFFLMDVVHKHRLSPRLTHIDAFFPIFLIIYCITI